jgi:CHC2-type zinc finger protein
MSRPTNINDHNLREYLTEFFDNKFYRDFRPLSYYYKYDKVLTRAKNIRIIEKDLSLVPHWFFFHFKKYCYNNLSNIYAELYPCQNASEFEDKFEKNPNNPHPNKIIDRLFFDFDLDNSKRAKELKDEILTDIAKKNLSTVNKKMNEYNQALLEKEKIALQPYKDMIKLYKHLESFDIKPYPVFSGSKGFHLYIFFPETTELTMDSINYLSLSIAEKFKKSCDLKSIDFNVNRDAYARLFRLPYCKHPVTQLYTYPIDIDDSYNDIIDKSFNPEIQDFKISDYKESEGNKAFTEHLLNLNEDYMKIKEELDKNKKLNQIRAEKRLKKYNGKAINNQNSIFSDCRKLAKEFLGDPVKNYGTYVTYHCPFHEDNNPSMSVYEKTFICGCFGKMNYFEFIKKIKGFNTDEEVKKFMKQNSKKKQ